MVTVCNSARISVPRHRHGTTWMARPGDLALSFSGLDGVALV
jgi:hypothetical protein